MTLQDKYLEEAADAILGNSFESIDYSGYSDSDGTVNFSDTSLTNEIGSRANVTKAKDSATVIEYNTTRSSANVVDTTNGDDIKEIGLFSDSSGSNMQIFIDVANINHTVDFDVETTQRVTVDRA